MLINEKIEIIISNSVKKYYRDKGYYIPNVNCPKIEIYSKDLSKGSTVTVKCECDVCGKINNVSYKDYKKSVDKYEYYSCKGICTRQKNIQSNIKKYGVIEPNNLIEIKEKIQNINLKNIGVKYPMQSDKIKEKSKQTCLKNYNVKNPMHSLEITIKQQKSALKLKKYKDTELYYQGTYELDFLEKYYNIGISKINTIKYVFENNNKVYYPDFYIKLLNLIVEIKSDYIYNKYLEQNLAKQKACIEQGYDFIFIINKNYTELDKKIKEK